MEPKASATSRDDEEQDESAAEVVADGVGGEVVCAALVEVADEAGIVGAAVSQVGRGDPDKERGEATDDPAPEGCLRARPRVVRRACGESGDAGRAEQDDQEREGDPALEEARGSED